MLRFTRREVPHTLAVGMTGVKLGDRLLQIGCADGGRFAAIASKVGLSGRAVVVVPNESAAARAQKAAVHAGVLVETETASFTRLPFDDGAFDLAVIDDSAGLLSAMPEAERRQTLGEALRVLRPGGRVMVIGSAPPSGLSSFFTRASGPVFDAAPALQTGGFALVRKLAERERLSFVEGVKSRS